MCLYIICILFTLTATLMTRAVRVMNIGKQAIKDARKCALRKSAQLKLTSMVNLRMQKRLNYCKFRYIYIYITTRKRRSHYERRHIRATTLATSPHRVLKEHVWGSRHAGTH